MAVANLVAIGSVVWTPARHARPPLPYGTAQARSRPPLPYGTAEARSRPPLLFGTPHARTRPPLLYGTAQARSTWTAPIMMSAETTDPLVAAAVADHLARPQPNVADAVLSYLHLRPSFQLPRPPAWVMSLDNAVHSDSFEVAWRFAGGDDWGMWVNNVGALATLAAFSMRDLLALRCLSIAGQICGITFCFTRDPPLWNPIAWQSIFLAVNVGNLAMLLQEQFGGEVPTEEEQAVYDRVFLPHGVTPAQFRRLLEVGQWKSLGDGQVVAIEGAAASDELTSLQLTLVKSGRLAYKTGGETLSVRRSRMLPRSPTGLGLAARAGWAPDGATDFLGDFVGDTSFLECLKEEPAEADVDTSAPCFVARESDEGGRLVTIETAGRYNRLLVWDSGALRQLLRDDLSLRARMVEVLAANLASKLEASQDHALPPPQPA